MVGDVECEVRIWRWEFSDGFRWDRGVSVGRSVGLRER